VGDHHIVKLLEDAERQQYQEPYANVGPALGYQALLRVLLFVGQFWCDVVAELDMD
jgi:hypothetical protein